MRILDAGCGSGRNLLYLLRAGYDIAAIDLAPSAVAATRQLAAALAPSISADNFRIETAENLASERRYTAPSSRRNS